MKDVLLDEDKYFTEETDHLREFLTALYRCIIDQVSWGTTEIYYLSSGIYALSHILDRCWDDYAAWQERRDLDPEAYGVDISQPDFADYEPDEHYPSLQALTWPKTRRERYKGNLMLLNPHEVNSSIVFYESLFCYRSLRGWKGLLNTWTFYALDKHKTILDDGKYTAASVFEDYMHLLKAVEMAWLEQEAGGNVSYHLKQPWFDMDNYPVFSAGDYIFNPYDQLYAAFHSKTLMGYKTDLDKWIRFACSPDKAWAGKPDVLVALFKDVCIITECCRAIHVQGPNYPENWDHTIASYTRKRAKEPGADYKYKLPESMVAHPENYLKDFFDDHTVNDIFDILFECLYTALGHEEPYPYGFDEIINVTGECICLLEAAYLIQKKKYPERDGREK